MNEEKPQSNMTNNTESASICAEAVYSEWLEKQYVQQSYTIERLQSQIEEIEKAYHDLQVAYEERDKNNQRMAENLEIICKCSDEIREENRQLRAELARRPEKCTIDQDANICVGCGDLQPEKPNWIDPRELTQEQRDAMPCVAPKLGDVVIRRDGSVRKVVDIVPYGLYTLRTNDNCIYTYNGEFLAGESYRIDIIAIAPEGIDIELDTI